MNLWIGANNHGHMGWFSSHSMSIRPADSDTLAWGASVSFGYAIFHVVFHGQPSQRMRLRGESHRALRRIWTPREHVQWPPPLLIPRRNLRGLATGGTQDAVLERAVGGRDR